MKMNLTAKMIVFFLLVVFVSLTGFAYIYYSVNSATDSVNIAGKNYLPRLIKASTINNNASDQVAFLRGYFITGDIQMFNGYKKVADENTAIEEELIKTALTVEWKKLISEAKVLDDKFSELAEKKFVPLLQTGKRAEAQQVLLGEMEPVYRALDEKMGEYQEFINKQTLDGLTQAVDASGKPEHHQCVDQQQRECG